MVVNWNNYVCAPVVFQAFQWDGTVLGVDSIPLELREKHGLKVIGKLLSIKTTRCITYARKDDYIIHWPWGDVEPKAPDAVAHLIGAVEEN